MSRAQDRAPGGAGSAFREGFLEESGLCGARKKVKMNQVGESGEDKDVGQKALCPPVLYP